MTFVRGEDASAFSAATGQLEGTEIAGCELDEQFVALRSLWSAVLGLAIMDFQHGLRRLVVPPTDPASVPGIGPRARLRRRERIDDWEAYFVTARAWLNGAIESPGSYVWVCDVLDLDPAHTLRMIHDPALLDRMHQRIDAAPEPVINLDDEYDDFGTETAAGHVEHHVGELARGEGHGEWTRSSRPSERWEDALDQFS